MMSDRLLLLRRKDKPLVDMSFLGSLPNAGTFTRTSSGWRFNASGQLVEETTDAPRFDYDPLTLAIKGLLIEEQRTNTIANSTFQGASTSPSTLPTGWAVETASNMTTTVVGLGSEYGMSYMDINVSGTPNASSYQLRCNYGTTASSGQTWAASSFLKVPSGSATGVTGVYILCREMGGSYTSTPSSALSIANTLQRLSAIRAWTTSHNAQWILRLAVTNGVAMDITLRLYAPQLELGETVSSPIPTSSETVTRAADNLSITSIPWFNALIGSFAGEFMIQAPAILAASRFVGNFNDGTTSNRITTYVSNTGKSAGSLTVSGSSKYSGSSPVLTPETVLKHAISYIENNTRVAADGALITINELGAAALPAGITSLKLGASVSSNYLNGWLRRFRYWNYNLDTTTLQKVTQ